MEKVKRTWDEISAVVGNTPKARMKWLLTIVGDRPKILKSAVAFSKMQQEMSAFMPLAHGQDEDKAFHISRPLAEKWYKRIFHGIGRLKKGLGWSLRVGDWHRLGLLAKPGAILDIMSERSFHDRMWLALYRTFSAVGHDLLRCH